MPYSPYRELQITPLMSVLSALNILIDSGEHDGITSHDVYRAIMDRRVLRFIRERSRLPSVTEFFFDDGPWPDFEAHFDECMLDVYCANEGTRLRRKFGVEHRGLCLVSAWTLGSCSSSSTSTASAPEREMDWIDRIKERLDLLPEVARMLGDTLAPEERARLRQLALDWPPERGDPPRELVRA